MQTDRSVEDSPEEMDVFSTGSGSVRVHFVVVRDGEERSFRLAGGGDGADGRILGRPGGRFGRWGGWLDSFLRFEANFG
jgi:hypothetical protein